MSKPSSGLFHGTNGDKEESKQIKFNLSNINDNIKKLEKKFKKLSLDILVKVVKVLR